MTIVKTDSNAMIAGRLNREIIEVVTPKIIIDEYGSQTTVYEHKFTTRAEMVNTSNNRGIINQDMVYIDRPILSIRHYHNIEDFDLIIHNKKKYRILGINHLKEQQRIEITVERIIE